MSDAIALEGVQKRFDDKVAVDELSLCVPRGSVYGFIGPNGSGKTTTLRMIMSILLPDRGTVEVLGERAQRAANDRISYLPEERGLYKRMTVRQQLEYFGELKSVPRGRLLASIDEWLGRLEARSFADQKIESLSKGMAQKVQFAAAVVSAPELLILDEPFSGLDPVNAEVLREGVLAERKRGATIVFSTHDMSAAEKLCDRVLMIFRGRKVLDGSLAEIDAEHGQQIVRVRTTGGRAILDGCPGVASVVDQGNEQLVSIDGDPQALLHALVARTSVQSFEIARSTLHDIFVQIARPHA